MGFKSSDTPHVLDKVITGATSICSDLSVKLCGNGKRQNKKRDVQSETVSHPELLEAIQRCGHRRNPRKTRRNTTNFRSDDRADELSLVGVSPFVRATPSIERIDGRDGATTGCGRAELGFVS